MTKPIDPLEGTLEEIFQKLEQESERRAQDEEDGDNVILEENKQGDTASVVALVASGIKDAPAVEAIGVSNQPKVKRRGSVSLSVFGQTSETSTDTASNTSSASPLPVSPLASAALKSTFYHSLPISADTLISENLVDDGNQTEDDQHHVTRMQTIAGRSNSISKTIDRVGALLSRNSTQRKRARRSSTLPLPADNGGLVIGVSVERVLTVETDSEYENPGYATVYAEGSRRAPRHASWFNIPSSTRSGELAMKAKSFTQKFRKRKPGNSETSSNS